MRLATMIIMGVVTAGLIAWDIYVAVKGRKRKNHPEEGPTISEVVHGMGRKYLIVPVAAGVLIGHFFWPQRPVTEKDCAPMCPPCVEVKGGGLAKQ